jgi:hypothetical protein
MIKNKAGQVVGAQIVDASTGVAFTGSVSMHVTGDGGTQVAGTVGGGICTHEGNGYHTYTPSQAETNYDQIGFTFTGAGALPVTVQVFTSQGDLFGPNVLVVTVSDDTTTDPIDGARVRLYRTGETGTIRTDEFGEAIFRLDSDNWDYVVTADGYVGDSGTITISADDTLQIDLVQQVLVPPVGPAKSTLTILCMDGAGDAEAGIDIDLRIVSAPHGDEDIAYGASKQTDTSDVNGLVTFQAVRGAVYEYKRGRADLWHRVTIEDAEATNVQSIIGAP